jgi:hypothetical protein
MSIAIAERQVGNRALDVRVVKASQFDDHTPQTPGMLRLAAVSHDLVGSEMLGRCHASAYQVGRRAQWPGSRRCEPDQSSQRRVRRRWCGLEWATSMHPCDSRGL